MKIFYNNIEREIAPNTSVYDLMSEEETKQYYICRINKSIKELRYILTTKNEGDHIELFGLDSLEAGKAYEATLRYIMAMAFYHLYPNLSIRFSYHISRSIFCEIKNKEGLHLLAITQAIEKEMKRIISLKLPIIRETISKQQAIELFKKFNYKDKLEAIKYRPDTTVHMYHCDDFYDYLYSYMAPSTGCITNFVIKPYSPGIILQYPRYELKAKIPFFEEESTYEKSLRKAHNWGIITQTQNIPAINHLIEATPIRDFIQMCETKHTNMLAELGFWISNAQEDIRLVAIAGPSSSGKTTFCNRLRIELMSQGLHPVMISLDNYYLSKEQIAKNQHCSIEDVDLENINCLDTKLFNDNLFDLINGEEVTLPYFNFQKGKREKGPTLKIDYRSPIMIEGIHALNDKLTTSIPKHQKYKIFISPQQQVNIDDHSPLSTTDMRLIRRIVRDMQFRACPAKTTIDMWPSIRNGEFKWIYPTQEGADYVFNSELTYELAVLKKYALPELMKIQPTDKEFIIANRLIKYLKYFKQIDDESSIPCNSLIREFIGGSCFDV